DPEYEANIAQWQAAYAPKDDANAKSTTMGRRENANTIPLGTKAGPTSQLSSADMHSAVNPDTGVAAVVAGADGKQKTVVRSGGGQTWQDNSLLEWDPSHFRIFVGNLAGEVTDESLLKAFAKYSSVQKARVVRDKRTTKSKGYGFVSFSNGDDYFQAARDMNGKYIGSHPVLIKRSTTEIKATVPKDHRKNNKHGKGGGKDRNGGGGGGNGAHGGANVGGGANTGAGVKKSSNKTRGGLKILG
ncbi:RNA-binding domain-containing protein, partial [Saccharata proteae CBS 121410]